MSSIPNPDDETNDPISYQVQYQEEGKTDWFIMTGRNWDEREYRSGVKHSGDWETASMDEAVEIAEALVNGYSHPHKRDKYYWRPIVAARVFTIIRLSKVTAVYGTPNTNVPRETSTEETS